MTILGHFDLFRFFSVVIARESQLQQSAGLAYWSDSVRLLSRTRILISWLAVTWSVQEEAFLHRRSENFLETGLGS